MLDQPLNLRDNTEIRVLMPLSPSCVLHCATGLSSANFLLSNLFLCISSIFSWTAWKLLKLLMMFCHNFRTWWTPLCRVRSSDNWVLYGLVDFAFSPFSMRKKKGLTKGDINDLTLHHCSSLSPSLWTPKWYFLNISYRGALTNNFEWSFLVYVWDWNKPLSWLNISALFFFVLYVFVSCSLFCRGAFLFAIMYCC